MAQKAASLLSARYRPAAPAPNLPIPIITHMRVNTGP
jgi:hypothetical protein